MAIRKGDQTTDQRFGEVIRRRREAMGLTQEEVATAMAAEGLSLSSTSLAKAEVGTRSVKIAEAVALARVLSLHLDLLELTDSGDELTALMSRASAEAATAARAASEATAEAERRQRQAAALDVLSRARTEPASWPRGLADLLEVAFGNERSAARAGLQSLGMQPEVLDMIENEEPVVRGGRWDWVAFAAGFRIAKLLPNLTIGH